MAGGIEFAKELGLDVSKIERLSQEPGRGSELEPYFCGFLVAGGFSESLQSGINEGLQSIINSYNPDYSLESFGAYLDTLATHWDTFGIGMYSNNVFSIHNDCYDYPTIEVVAFESEDDFNLARAQRGREEHLRYIEDLSKYRENLQLAKAGKEVKHRFVGLDKPDKEGYDIAGEDVEYIEDRIIPNFVHKQTNFQLSWYKRPLRTFESNRVIDNLEFLDILKSSLDSIPKQDRAYPLIIEDQANSVKGKISYSKR